MSAAVTFGSVCSGIEAIPGASDTARYKALGNSWPVPLFNWIGKRIDQQLGDRPW